MADYILITAAHNEEAFIERTCHSVIAQSVRPKKWIIVDDASTDQTAQIVQRYESRYPELVKLIRLSRPPGRDFRNKVRAFEHGFKVAQDLGFDFIGNLDADISFAPDYFAKLLGRFKQQTALGIAGGTVLSLIDGQFVKQQVASDSVAGAVQMFRKECFGEIGGYLPLPLGGIDAAAEIMARKAGWLTRTFADIQAFESRRTGSTIATPLAARRREGARMFSLGYSFTFFTARCLRRSLETPKLIGSAMALYGYLACMVQGHPVVLPHDVVAFLRDEQRRKLLHLLKLNTTTRPSTNVPDRDATLR